MTPLEVVEEAYRLAKRADHRKLRELIADDATWLPAREGVWNPCRDADSVVKTMLWRASSANRMRPGEAIELGDRVIIQLKGRRLERLGAKGLIPKLFQVVEVRSGKIVKIHDYPRRDAAMTSAGVTP